MYARWLLEDATSALDAQLLELSPSLLGPVTTVQPSVQVTQGDIWLRAKAWRDSSYEAQSAKLCIHLAAASIHDVPAAFTLKISGLCHPTNETCAGLALNATHIFTEAYSTLMQPGAAEGPLSVHVLSDIIMPGTTAVYAIGCDTFKAELGNLVNDPGFEATELPLTPGFITCSEESKYPQGTFKGKCKVEDKHAGSWGLSQHNELRDGRASFFVDSQMPHAGRHSGRIWLPSAKPITFGVPGYTTNLDGISVVNNTAYQTELYARSFPPGLTIKITLGLWESRGINVTSPLGLSSYMQYVESFKSPIHVLSAGWTRITLDVPKRVWKEGVSFNLQIGSPTRHDVFAAGSVWIDDVSVQNMSSN